MLKRYLIILPLLVGCSQGGDNRLKEKAQIESETAATNQTKAEVEKQNKRAKEMEIDLARRHSFFQTVKGKFEGTFKTDLGDFQIRILLVPSLNPVKVDRVRLPEEVAADLNNLHFNAQIQLWSAGNPSSAGGCRVEGIRPDLANGLISIVSSNCPNVYVLALSDGSSSKNISDRDHYYQMVDGRFSAQMAQDIVDGKTNSLDEIAGFLQMTNVANSYHFRVKRVEQ